MEGGGREGGQSPRAKYEVSQRLTCLEAQPPHHHTQDTGGGQKDTCDTTQHGCQWSTLQAFLNSTFRAKKERRSL